MSFVNDLDEPTHSSARTSTDFNRQMADYRTFNRNHPGVAEYGQRHREGFNAHVEGLWHQARSVDSPSGVPLAANDPSMGVSLGAIKAQDLEDNYSPAYRSSLTSALRNGTADPIHVSSGRRINRDYNIHSHLEQTQSHNDPWLGNGNHRLALAHMNGVQFIRAQDSFQGTHSDKYGTRKSWADANPEAT